jgi:NAD-dependent dihydropyrimidine dehydrogenase PreA subunit
MQRRRSSSKFRTPGAVAYPKNCYFPLDFICPGGYNILLFRHFTFIKEETGSMAKVTVDKGKCDGDGVCADVCPQNVFEIQSGKAVPVNEGDCINCQACVEGCPQKAITVEE